MGIQNDLHLDETPDETAMRLGTTAAASDAAKPADEAASAPTADDTTPVAAAPADAPAPAADAATVDATAAEAAPEPAPAAEPAALQVEAIDFKAKLAELDTKEADIESKWAAGELSDEDRAKQLREVRNEVREIDRAQTRAETIADINRQNEERAQAKELADNKAVIERIRPEGAKLGLDYSPGAQHAIQFDAALRSMLASGMKFAEAAEQAHRTVQAVNGKLPAAAAPTPAAPTAKPKPVIPTTLGDLPAAGAPNIGNGLMESLQTADPDEAEAMLAKMPARERENLLRSTMPVAARR